MPTDETDELIAAWWAQWLPKDKRAAFTAELLQRLPEGEYFLYNDYHPRRELLDAVRAAGIECRGCMFFGDDIGFPQKSGTRRDANGRAWLKYGYGANDVPLSRENLRQWRTGHAD